MSGRFPHRGLAIVIAFVIVFSTSAGTVALLSDTDEVSLGFEVVGAPNEAPLATPAPGQSPPLQAPDPTGITAITNGNIAPA